MPNANSVVEVSSSASGSRKSSGSTSVAAVVNVSSSASTLTTNRFSRMRQEIYVEGENEGTAAHSWWKSPYIYRRRVAIKTPHGEAVHKNHPVVVSLPLGLISSRKVRRDLEDIEVIYASGAELNLLYREVRILEDRIEVAFKLFEDIPENTIVQGQYYIYYGNLSLEDQPRRPSRDLEFVISPYLPEGFAVPDQSLPDAPESFSDVSSTHPYYSEIMWLRDAGITEGFVDGTFRPSQVITRGIFAIMLYRMFGSPEGPFPDPEFSDITTGGELEAATDWMAYEGITQGFSDGTFRPNEQLQRSTLALFLYRAAGEPERKTDSRFSDVRFGHRHYDAIVWLSEANITQGYADFTFRPDNFVHRQHVAFFLFRFVHDMITLFDTEDSTSIFNRANWPAKTDHKSDMVSYTRPGEHWIEGSSRVRHARASCLLYAEHFRILSKVGPDRAIMEVQIDGSPWEEVDLFSLTEEIVPVFDAYHLSPDIHEIRMRVSGKSNEASLGDVINIDSVEYFKSVQALDEGEDVVELFWKTSTGGS